MVPEIELVLKMVLLVHCYHIPWIACEVSQPSCLALQMSLTLSVVTFSVPLSQKMLLECQDWHNRQQVVQDASLLVEIDSGLEFPYGRKDLKVSLVVLVAKLALDKSVE